MSNLALSIIVPIYNVEEYLDECLSSIYKLTDVNYEVILVNDGSPDNSDRIIENYRAQYPEQTKVVNKENGGLSAARNTGFEYAVGDYVAFIDSDDYINSNALKKLLEQAKNADLDIAFAQSVTFWKGEQETFVELEIPSEIVSLKVARGKELLTRSFELGYRRINCWNKIYRREFLTEHQLKFKEGWLYEDVPFSFQAFFVAEKTQAFSDNFYYYRQRPGSIMTNTKNKLNTDRLKIIELILALFKQHKFNSKAFDDYLVYLLWENARGTKHGNTRLAITLLKRHKMSFKGAVRLLTVLFKIPNLLKQ